ncbi:MAG: NAD-dependent epimerase/dehydratase family protein [Devosia sp.]
MSKGQVLVTGASGFVGKWTVIELLRAGYSVRGAVRVMARADEVRQAVVAELGDGVLYRLSFVKLDLMLDHGWRNAMLRLDGIVHTAALVRAEEPRDTRKIIGAAVDGTERVMRFATMAGVRRVVMTSSAVTIGYGHGDGAGQHRYSEADFTNLAAIRRPWADLVGKTKAERVGWAYVRNEELQMTTIHPGVILGPALDERSGASLQLVSGLLDGSIKALPRCGVSISDVRDVAALHVAALQQPKSIGERYLAASNYISLTQVASILGAAYPDRPITPKSLPDWIIRLSGLFGRASQQTINDLGNQKHYARDKGEALLGQVFRSGETAVLAAAESIIGLGLLEPKAPLAESEGVPLL